MNKKSIPMMVLTVFLAAAVMGLQAADLYVTTTADQVAGSLRATITTANSNGEDDTIHLPAGLYLLTGTADEDGNIGGDLDIDSSQAVTIKGEGVGKTIVDGNQLDRENGIFYWQPGPGFVGEYRFAFIGKKDDGQYTGKHILVYIKPKY